MIREDARSLGDIIVLLVDLRDLVSSLFITPRKKGTGNSAS